MTYHSGLIVVTVRMNGRFVSTNSLNNTHSGVVSNPQEGCNDTTLRIVETWWVNSLFKKSGYNQTHLIIFDSEVGVLLSFLKFHLPRIVMDSECGVFVLLITERDKVVYPDLCDLCSIWGFFRRQVLPSDSIILWAKAIKHSGTIDP